jgi:hypothetical protein
VKPQLVLDCERGGTVSLDSGQIMMLYYSTSGALGDKWTQRGAVATSVPHLSSVNPSKAVRGGSVTITGTNLAQAMTVEISESKWAGGIGEKLAAFDRRTNTDTYIEFVMPDRNPGVHTVLVTTPHGASNLLSIEAQQPNNM